MCSLRQRPYGHGPSASTNTSPAICCCFGPHPCLPLRWPVFCGSRRRSPGGIRSNSLDGVAGILVQSHPKLAKRMETLASNRNFWLRRIAIQHQLTFAERTDAERLFRICLANAADPEFFIRKAIGWALRDYAHHDPRTVRRFLDQHGSRFSSLTLRKSRRHL